MDLQTENEILSRSARASRKKKQEHESLQSLYRELETKNKALSMHVDAFNTLQHTEVTEAIVFTSIGNESESWTNLSIDKRSEIEDNMQAPHHNIFYRQEVKDFLPYGVDIKVTVRMGASLELILDNLYQIIQSIHRDKLLVTFNYRNPSYVIFNPNDGDSYYDYGANVKQIIV